VTIRTACGLRARVHSFDARALRALDVSPIALIKSSNEFAVFSALQNVVVAKWDERQRGELSVSPVRIRDATYPQEAKRYRQLAVIGGCDDAH
jgi:hypothetical protein